MLSSLHFHQVDPLVMFITEMACLGKHGKNGSILRMKKGNMETTEVH